MARPIAAIRSTALMAGWLVLVAGLAFAGAPDRGSNAPDFVLKSVAGQNYRLSEYRGEIVMLTFWATWCGDCRAQLEALGALRERYEDAGVELLAVSLDENQRQVDKVASAIGARYPVLHDPAGQVGRLYDVSRMPVMVLIDRGGVVRDVFEGFRRGHDQEYVARVQALLRE